VIDEKGLAAIEKKEGDVMPQEEEFFREALIGKKIPVLTLDNQWHKLFTQTGENDEIHDLEDKLNEVLKRQGKLNTEIKSLSAYKKKVLQEIVNIMELPDSASKEKKMSENKRIIEETNQQIEEYNDELLELPKQIDEANFNLMLATMRVCYARIQQNVSDIDEINQWVAAFRVKLKKQILLKQKKEIWNDEMYSYMHSIFGPDVIDVFDMKYNPKNVLNKETDVIGRVSTQEDNETNAQT
jgi:vacuolar-type H+-ATPase subunit I/STV1